MGLVKIANQIMLILNQIKIKSRAFKLNRRVVKSNHHKWFNHDSNKITVWFSRHWYIICCIFYAPQLCRQALLRRVLAMAILSVCLSVRHDPVRIQCQVR